MATSSNTARPATPPTIPPARTDAGGVLVLLLSLVTAELDVADAGAAAVPVTLAALAVMVELSDDEKVVDAAEEEKALLSPELDDAPVEDASGEDDAIVETGI